METNIHTHRSVRFSLRESRMLGMAPPTPGESADRAIEESRALAEALNSQDSVDAAAMLRVDALVTQLGTLAADPTLAARAVALRTERATLETARDRRRENDTTLSALKAPNARDNRVKEVRDAPVAGRAAFGAGKVKTYFEAIHKSVDEEWHNVGGVTKEHAETIKLIVALDNPPGLSLAINGHADVRLNGPALNVTTPTDARLIALATARMTYDAKVVDVDNACSAMPPPGPARDARVRLAKNHLTQLTALRTVGFTSLKTLMKDIAMPAGGAARAANAPDVLIFLANQREEVNREYFRVRNLVRSFDPTLSPTPGPVVPTPGLDRMDAGIRPQVQALRDKIINGQPYTGELAAVNAHYASLAAPARATFLEDLDAFLGRTTLKPQVSTTNANALELVTRVGTGPTVAPAEVDRAIDTFSAANKTHLRNLRRWSVEGKPVTDPGVVAAFNAINTDFGGFFATTALRDTYYNNVVTALSGTRYRVELVTPSSMRLVEAAPGSVTSGPSATPLSAAEMTAALPPMPAGLERRVNPMLERLAEGRRLLDSIGFEIPPIVLRALNTLNGRELRHLDRQLAARRSQLAEARTQLTTADATTRPLIERRIQALQQDIAAREEQLNTLRGASERGDPESRRMWNQLLRMFMGVQRDGMGLGVMPWARRYPTGSYGFDLYGLNNGGNLVLGHAARQYGNQFGYYPYGGASIINYGPMYVNGGGVSMGGGYAAPGRLPFSPRGGMPPTGPFPGGGYVVGGGYFSGRKPSGSDSRPR